MPAERTKKRTAHLVGIIMGSVLLLGAPLAGLLGSVLGVALSFKNVDAVPPEDKAKVLADGISGSMDLMVVGAIVSGIGLIVLLVSLVLFRKGQSEIPRT